MRFYLTPCYGITTLSISFITFNSTHMHWPVKTLAAHILITHLSNDYASVQSTWHTRLLAGKPRGWHSSEGGMSCDPGAEVCYCLDWHLASICIPRHVTGSAARLQTYLAFSDNDQPFSGKFQTHSWVPYTLHVKCIWEKRDNENVKQHKSTSKFLWQAAWILIHFQFEILRYKPEGRGFDYWWCIVISHWQSFWRHYKPGFDSASNRNWYQEYFTGGEGGWCVGLTTVPPSCADCLGIW